jgi:hypothetical protein
MFVEPTCYTDKMIEGIPLSPGIRATLADSTTRKYNETTGKKSPLFPVISLGEKLLKVDQLALRAKNLLVSFSENYDDSSEKGKNLGWSMIKKYSTPGTGYLFAKDPIGQNSIVVAQYTDGGHPDLFWVSDQLNPNNGVPYVYCLLRVEDGKGKLVWEATLYPFPRKDDDAEFASNIFIINKNKNPSQINIDRYEVWKEGKSLTAKKPKKLSTRVLQVPILQPQPQPIPIQK